MSNAAGAYIFQATVWDSRVDNVTQSFQMGLFWNVQGVWLYLHFHITLTQLGPATLPEHTFEDCLTSSEPGASEQGWSSHAHFGIKGWYLLSSRDRYRTSDLGAI